jgi:endogenous inhibitor of DNA gyrase (YacG/DUF329 family)
MMKVRCPICDKAMPGQSADYPDYPFCSARCRKIDLGRWLGERYRLPASGERKDDAASSDAPAPPDGPDS